ncbi:MAG: LysM peptidoglycan-binding domain-containing protein [Gammaproteobacteria bacterium]
MPTLLATAAALTLFASGTAQARDWPVTAGQRATANQVAQAGVPLSELAPDAPDQYTIKRGDTLWDISKIFLRSPWRWPELWGMNLEQIRNPHLIYPGQQLYLIRDGDRARLSTTRPGGGLETVKVSPRIRAESLSASAIPPVRLQAIESFLTEPLVVEEDTFSKAPRIVATPENRVLLSRGDRAYARARYGSDTTTEPLSTAGGKTRDYRVFRSAVPLKDPTTGEILGHETQYVGRVYLARDETVQPAPVDPSKDKDTGAGKSEIVPATIDVVSVKEELRVGDRLLPEPPRDLSTYVPSAPPSEQNGQIVKVYGNGVTYAGQNQVVAINRGTEHGLERGHVLALLRDAGHVVDKTDDSRTMLRLPGERNGLMMVFLTFNKVSYALILEVGDAAKVGDRFVNP